MIIDLRQGDEGEQDAEQVFRTKERLRALSSRLLNAQEEERKRLAHEVHEDLAQSLMAIQFRVETALSEVEGVANPKIRELLEPVTGILQEGLGRIRRIASELRPLILDDLGILVTISRLCRQVADDHPGLGIRERLEIEEREIPEPLKLVIYRTLESALCSILKKPCGTVEVALRRKGPLITLAIRNQPEVPDQEQPLSADEPPACSNGVTIRERAMLSGGSVAVIQHDGGGGATLKVTWPVQ